MHYNCDYVWQEMGIVPLVAVNTKNLIDLLEQATKGGEEGKTNEYIEKLKNHGFTVIITEDCELAVWFGNTVMAVSSEHLLDDILGFAPKQSTTFIDHG